MENENKFQKHSTDEASEVSQSLKDFLWEIVKIVIIALIIIIPVRYAVAQPFSVKGDSMQQNFHSGDYLIIDELTYKFREPERGEVIVFRFPENPREYFIKRIVGLPGETVKIENGEVIVVNSDHPNGVILDETAYLGTYAKTPGTLEIELDDGEYAVLGDNRAASSDSRTWGVLPEKYIIGRALVRAWPFRDFSLIEKPAYY